MIRTFIDSDMFLLTLTVGLYCGGVALHHRLRLAILHPTLLAFVALILFLKVCGIDYGHYRQATEILDFLLGMSVVALGYLMYEQTDRLRGQVLPILTSIGVGCTVGVLSVVYIARALGADRTILNSIAPKSVTVPIAVAISEPLGGVVSVTSVVSSARACCADAVSATPWRAGWRSVRPPTASARRAPSNWAPSKARSADWRWR